MGLRSPTSVCVGPRPIEMSERVALKGDEVGLNLDPEPAVESHRASFLNRFSQALRRSSLPRCRPPYMVHSGSYVEPSAVELSRSSQGFNHFEGTTARTAHVTLDEQNRQCSIVEADCKLHAVHGDTIVVE